MNNFLEFFVERMVWLWKPLYAFYRVLRDLVEEQENKNNSK